MILFRFLWLVVYLRHPIPYFHVQHHEVAFM